MAYNGSVHQLALIPFPKTNFAKSRVPCWKKKPSKKRKRLRESIPSFEKPEIPSKNFSILIPKYFAQLKNEQNKLDSFQLEFLKKKKRKWKKNTRNLKLAQLSDQGKFQVDGFFGCWRLKIKNPGSHRWFQPQPESCLEIPAWGIWGFQVLPNTARREEYLQLNYLDLNKKKTYK